jgi:hypothetical protein
MKRLLILWLTLFPAFWLARTAAAALLVQRIDSGYGAFLQLITIPLLQTLGVSWATRGPGPLPLSGLWREIRGYRVLLELLAVDAVVLVLGAVFHRGSFFSLAMNGGWSLPGIVAGIQAAAAGVAVARLAYRERWTRMEGLRLGALAAGLAGLGVLLIRDWFHPVTDYLLLDIPPLQRWLAVDVPLLALGITLVLWVQPLLDRRNPSAGAALDVAVGLWLLGAMTSLLGLFGVEAPAEPWASLGGACLLLAATALLAAALLAQDGETEGFDPGEI